VNDAAARTRAIAAFGLAMLLAGAAATSLVPLNKPLWTASFTLVTAALGLLTWALLRAIWSIVGDTFVGRASVLLGKTALTLYVVQTLVIALLVIKTPDGVRWWQRLFDLLASTGIPGPWASLLFATVFSMLCVAVMPAFYRRRWLLRA
jgi:predicted acyltransferase